MPRPKLPPVIKVSMPAQLGAKLTAPQLADLRLYINAAETNLGKAKAMLAALEGRRK